MARDKFQYELLKRGLDGRDKLMTSRLMKRLISGALALTLVFSINGFAAIVTDSDGSAFITKAEFDSLKNSFQAQIDSYNKAIDSKIDGAIAAYLSGIRMSTESKVAVTCYDPNGILCVRGREDACWSEGRMEVDLLFTTRRWSTTARALTAGSKYSGEYSVHVKSKEATPFNELSVKNVDRAAKTAEWTGVSTTMYKDSTYNQLVYFASYVFGDTGDNFFALGWGEDAKTNTPLVDWGERHRWGLFNTATGNAGTFLSGNSKYSNLQRLIQSADKTNVIITKNDIAEHRFSDYDAIMDYQNDTTDQTGHTAMNLADYVDSCEATLYYQTQAGTAGSDGYYKQIISKSKTYTLIDETNKINWGSWVSSSATAAARALPYVGFCGIQNWNHLWTRSYDNVIDEIQRVGAADVFVVDGTKHLGIVAGAPIAALTHGDHVKMTVEFADKSKDYDIWLKPSAFLASTNPTEDSACLNNITGAVAGTAPKSYKIQNGLGHIEFELENDSYVFLKWSYAGNNGAGGGTFLPPKTITVVSGS